MHYGWVIVGLVFATQFFGNAMGFYAFGIVLAPLAEELGASRASVAMIPFSLSWAGAALGPLLGRAVTKFPIQRIMAAGALALGLSYFAMSQATALWQLLLGYGLGVAFGMNALAGIVPAALVVNWFEDKRALALGIGGIGISLAGFLMAPITAAWVEAHGWRGTFQIFGWIAVSLAPIVLWIGRSHPADRGSKPYGARETGEGAQAGGSDEPLTTRELLRMPALWLLASTGGVCFLMSTALTTHLVTLGMDAGYTAADAAWLLSVAAGMAAVAKLLFTWLAERIGERPAFVIGIALHGVGLAGLAELDASYPALLAAAAIFGLGMGSSVPLYNAVMARVFGAASFGPATGLAGAILVFFQSGGAPALGYAFDVSGSYDVGLWILVGLLVIPITALSLVRFPKPGE